MLLNYITWNVNPELFSIGSLTVRWYGLLWAIGIWLALVVVQKIFKSENYLINVDSLFIYTVIGTIVGARLGHCFFYEWKPLAEPVTFLGITFTYGNYYLSHPWELLYIWRGGLASHGGAIGILIAMYLYNKNVSKKGFIWILDRLVIWSGFDRGSYQIGKPNEFGNLRKRYYPALGIYFRTRRTNRTHASYSDLRNVVLSYHFRDYLVVILEKQAYKKTGLIFGVFLIGIFGTRFLLEFIKLNQESFEAGMLLNMGQVLSIPFIIWGIWLIVRSSKKALPEK